MLGVAIGVAAALALSRDIATMLFEIDRFDAPPSYAATAAAHRGNADRRNGDVVATLQSVDQHSINHHLSIDNLQSPIGSEVP